MQADGVAARCRAQEVRRGLACVLLTLGTAAHAVTPDPGPQSVPVTVAPRPHVRSSHTVEVLVPDAAVQTIVARTGTEARGPRTAVRPPLTDGRPATQVRPAERGGAPRRPATGGPMPSPRVQGGGTRLVLLR